MALGAFLVELLFGGLGLVPDASQAQIVEQGMTWSYTRYLSMVALAMAALMLVGSLRTGGREMPAMMGRGTRRHGPLTPLSTWRETDALARGGIPWRGT